MLKLLCSHSSSESSLQPSCANIVRTTVKVNVALVSLVNGLKDSLSGRMGYGNKGWNLQFSKTSKICLPENGKEHENQLQKKISEE